MDGKRKEKKQKTNGIVMTDKERKRKNRKEKNRQGK
jgi:hypothetical protein